jgi:hypothetical protein
MTLHLYFAKLLVLKYSTRPGIYPSTFADPRLRKEDSVFVTHECSPGGLGAKYLKTFAISAS